MVTSTKLYRKYVKIWYHTVLIINMIQKRFLTLNQFRLINIENSEMHNKA
jgi:hypothetical protein